MATRKVFIVYDQRAASGETDAAMVMVACDSLREARSYRKTFPGCVVYEYDLVGDEAINEQFVEILT